MQKQVWLSIVLCINLLAVHICMIEVIAVGHQCFGKSSSDTVNVCSGRGTCVRTDVCECTEPTLFGGTECEIGLCGGLLPTDPNVCSGVGVCSITNGAFATCTCSKDVNYIPNDYLGFFCEIPTCLDFDIDNSVHDMSNLCNLRGTCIGVNACKCDRNATVAYGGFSCEKYGFQCFGVNAESAQSCSGNGVCIDSDVCTCDTNHIGNDCSIPKCYGVPATDSNVCSSKGKCIGVNNCQCDSGYSGENCQLFGASTTTVVTLVSNLNFTCFGLEKFSSLVCSGKGLCKNPDVCSCVEGYYGRECELTSCFGVPINESQSCNARGVCKDFNQCQCSSTNPSIAQIDGSDCGKLYCKGSNNEFYLSTDPNVCSGNGKCSINGCICGDGFYGPSCSQFTCFSQLNNHSSVCSSHGKCIAIDTCECFYNETHGYWIGEECNICDSNNGSYQCSYSCSDEQSCNNLGSCRGGVCICSDNFSGSYCQECKKEYYGPLCETYCSDNISCSSHGVCNRDGGFCECFNSLEDGYWKGSNCTQCKDGYYGTKCQISIGTLFSFNNLGNELNIPIILPYTNPSLQPFNCSHFFKDSTLYKLGNINCQWLSVQGNLRVYLPSSATILPGDSVELDVNSFEIQPLTRYFIEVKSSVIHNITASPIPKILYLENETFLSFTGCNAVPIERESSNSYLWTISTCQLTDLSSTCKSSLQSVINSQQTASNIIIEKKDLPKNMISLTIQLEVTNRFGLKRQPTSLLVNTTLMTISNNNNNGISSNNTVYSLKMMVDRNPVAYTLNTIPIFVEKKFSINGVETTISNPFSIEYSMDPPSPKDATPADIVSLVKDAKNDLIIDVPNFDLSGIDPTIKYQIMAIVKKGVEQVANATFDIYFGITADRFYLNAPTPYNFNSLIPLSISVNIPPSSILKSVQWKCTSFYEYNGSCHSALDNIMKTANINNQITISIPKSTYFMYNSPFFISVIVQTVGGKEFTAYKSYETFQGLSVSSINLNGQSTNGQNTMGTVWLVSSNDVLKLYFSKATGVNSYESITGTVTMTVYDGFDSNTVITPTYATFDNILKVLTITGSQFTSNVRAVLSYVDNTDSITYKYNIYIFRNTNNLPSISVSTNVETSKVFTHYDHVKVTVDLLGVPYFRPYLFVTLALPNKDIADSCQDHGESKIICEFVIPPLMENTKIMLKSKFLNAELEKMNAFSEYVISQQLSELPAQIASPHTAVYSLQRLVYTDNSQLSFLREQLNYYLYNLNLNLYPNNQTV